jgi:hypothetical protein
MFVRRSLLAFALALSAVRCADQPTAVNPPAGPQFLKWASTPKFSARMSRERRSGAITMAAPVSVTESSVSFWAVRGEARSIEINYSTSTDTVIKPFYTLTTTDPVFVPGVGELAVGDSVLMTVTVDTVNIGVTLEPSGLEFGIPAESQITYSGAAGDLNGDGAADSTDTVIETRLGLWAPSVSSEAWTPVAATQAVTQQSFTYGVTKSSTYAIAEWAVQY